MPGLSEQYKNGFLYNISPAEIHENPGQPRQSIDEEEFENLKRSIQSKGLIQPLIVSIDNDRIVVIDGHRRLKACRELNLSNIPSFFIERNDEEIALISNLQRDDLHPIDEAEALFKIQNNNKYNQEKLAQVIGKKQNTISEILKLNRIPLDIRNECRGDKRWSRKMLLDIARKRDDEKKRDLFEAYKAKLENKRRERSSSTDPKVLTTKCNSLIRNLNYFDELSDDQMNDLFDKKDKKTILESLDAIQARIERMRKKLG